MEDTSDHNTDSVKVGHFKTNYSIPSVSSLNNYSCLCIILHVFSPPEVGYLEPENCPLILRSASRQSKYS